MLKKILVVEDEKATLNYTRQVLEMHDYVVTAVNNGRNAFKTAQTFRPDLIILDVLLAGEDGRKICRSLKRNELTRPVPTIMMSSHPDAEKSVLASGANAFIAKPFEIEDFISLIEIMLEKSAAHNFIRHLYY